MLCFVSKLRNTVKTAKPLCAGSIPARASNPLNDLRHFLRCRNRGTVVNNLVTPVEFLIESPSPAFPAQPPQSVSAAPNFSILPIAFHLVLLCRMGITDNHVDLGVTGH
jgi:hypothetical protein